MVNWRGVAGKDGARLYAHKKGRVQREGDLDAADDLMPVLLKP